jgi:hypothetical protein
MSILFLISALGVGAAFALPLVLRVFAPHLGRRS